MDFSELHIAALAAASRLRSAEVELIALLQEIEACRGHLKLGYPSLFAYTVSGLGLSEATSYHLINVSRKAREVPELKLALMAGEITLSKAKVISSVLKEANKEHWLHAARTQPKRELEKMVAKENPTAAKIEKVRFLSAEIVGLEISLTEAELNSLRRAQDLLAQKRHKHLSLAETIAALATEYIHRHDPVEKAARSSTVPGDSSRQIPQQNQSKLTAHSRHIVNIRDRGRCQYRLPNGEQCQSRRWLHIHHRKPKAAGGSHEPENLVTLCSAHHRIAHKSDTRPLYHS
jgi:5-methylcytosine-specific restriction endonuclease McrA